MLAEIRAYVHHDNVMGALLDSDFDAWNTLHECRSRIALLYCDGLEMRPDIPLPTAWTERLNALAEFALFHGPTTLTEAMPGPFDPLNDDQVLSFLSSLKPDDHLRHEFLTGLKVLLHRDPLDPGDASLRPADSEVIHIYAASVAEDSHGHGPRISAILRTIATALANAEDQPQPSLIEAAADAGVRPSLAPMLSALSFEEEEVNEALDALNAAAGPLEVPDLFGLGSPMPDSSRQGGPSNWETSNMAASGSSPFDWPALDDELADVTWPTADDNAQSLGALPQSSADIAGLAIRGGRHGRGGDSAGFASNPQAQASASTPAIGSASRVSGKRPAQDALEGGAAQGRARAGGWSKRFNRQSHWFRRQEHREEPLPT